MHCHTQAAVSGGGRSDRGSERTSHGHSERSKVPSAYRLRDISNASSCDGASKAAALKPQSCDPHCTVKRLNSFARGTSLPRGPQSRSEVALKGGGAGGSGGSGGSGEGGGLGGEGGSGGGLRKKKTREKQFEHWAHYIR